MRSIKLKVLIFHVESPEDQTHHQVKQQSANIFIVEKIYGKNEGLGILILTDSYWLKLLRSRNGILNEDRQGRKFWHFQD